MILPVVACSVMLQAPAIADQDAKAVGYSISVEGPAVPDRMDSVDYPRSAIRRGREGSCELEITRDALGSAQVDRVVSCSHPSFRREALDLIGPASMVADPRSLDTGDRLVVSWSIGG